jgi:hypothetical protein
VSVTLIIQLAELLENDARALDQVLRLAGGRQGNFDFELLVLHVDGHVSHHPVGWQVAPTPALLAALSGFGEVILPPENVREAT